MLGVFRNTFTCNDKYPVRDCENLLSPIQMILFLKPKNFSNSFVSLLESTSNFKHFEKKRNIIGTLFRKLQTVKDLVRPLTKNTVSEHPLTFKMSKGTKLLQNLHEGSFSTFFHHSERTSFGKYLL